jgi:hypothetical protein
MNSKSAVDAIGVKARFVVSHVKFNDEGLPYNVT